MIYISAQRFNNEFRSAQNLGYLLSCIGEKVIIETDFYFEDITYVTADNFIQLKPDAVDVDLVDSTGVIWSEDGQAFVDCQVGDTVGVYNSVTPSMLFYTISQKFNDGMVRTDYAGAKVNLDPGNDYIFNATPFAGARYAWNLIDSGNSFNSLIDGEFQQGEYLNSAASPTDDTTYRAMSFKGILSYQIGSIEIKGRNGTGGTNPNYAQQKFTIKHTTWITPLFLAAQYNDLLLAIKPSYFLNESCLNYVAQIQCGRNLSNPNGFQELNIPFQFSNIGWFNEKFNGSKTNYSLTSLVITADAIAVNALQFGTTNIIDIIIGNTADSPFSSGNTKFIFGFNYLPDSEDYYQNNGRNQTTNFVIDTKLNTLGSGVANGNNIGTTMQVIESVTSTYISTSSAKITARINLGTAAEAIIRQGDYSRYQFWVIIENHALAAASSDKVNLLCQVSEFEETLTTSDLITATNNFITHPYGHTDTGAFIPDQLDVFPVDDIAVLTDFSIDFTGRTLEGILIKKITCRLVLTHTTEADIVLDTFSENTSAYPLVAGLVQDIDFSQDRVFKIPSEIRRTITISRNYTLDSGNVYNWQINFPFMNRWEYWEVLSVLNPPSGIFDNTKPLNGLNHFWNRLINVSGWTLEYQVNFELEQNGEDFEQTFSSEINSFDFETGAEWTNEFVKSYDPAGVTEQVDGSGNKYISGYQDTYIKASFEKLSGTLPTVSEVEIVIWIEAYESGGISGIRRTSSKYDNGSETWFKSVDSSNQVKLTKTGSTYLGETKIDYTKLPANSEFTIYARIYDLKGGCATGALETEDAYCILTEDGVSILVE